MNVVLTNEFPHFFEEDNDDLKMTTILKKAFQSDFFKYLTSSSKVLFIFGLFQIGVAVVPSSFITENLRTDFPTISRES